MVDHLGPAPPAQGTDLIARAVGALVLATSAVTPPSTPVRRAGQAANRPRQTTAEGGRSR
jgi:hypothetical protein